MMTNILKKKIDKNSFLKYKIPKYEMKQYPKDKKYYSLIFETYRTEHINLKDYKKIEKINDWINSETDILKLFTKRINYLNILLEELWMI